MSVNKNMPNSSNSQIERRLLQMYGVSKDPNSGQWEAAETRLLRKHGVYFDDDAGQWVTTENGHHVHIGENGEPDKGNKHVIASMSGIANTKQNEGKASSKGGNVEIDKRIKSVKDAEFQPVKPANKYASAHQANTHKIKVPGIGEGEINYFLKKDGSTGAYAFAFNNRGDMILSVKCDSPDEARKMVKQSLIDSVVNN